MNRVIIDLEALQHNLMTVNGWIQKHGSFLTMVTKVLCGHPDTLKALQVLGVRSMGDSRLANFKAVDRIFPEFEAWYLRLPHMSIIEEVVSLTDVSLNSETETIERLNDEAGKQDKRHKIIVMIELGDLREGILPGSLIEFYNKIFEMPHIYIQGIGANLGCIGGIAPSIDQLMQLVLYKELLELKFDKNLPFISAGSSNLLPLLLEGKVPKEINHFRIGEAIFLGTDLVNGGTLHGLRDNAIMLEAEIVEIKEKSLIPIGDTTSMTPFDTVDDDDVTYGDRGYRAIVTVGQLDTEVTGLTPLKPNYTIAGASSDLAVVNVGKESEGLSIGDSIKFRVNYAAMLRLMSSNYIEKVVAPSIDEFSNGIKDDDRLENNENL